MYRVAKTIWFASRW